MRAVRVQEISLVESDVESVWVVYARIEFEPRRLLVDEKADSLRIFVAASF